MVLEGQCCLLAFPALNDIGFVGRNSDTQLEHLLQKQKNSSVSIHTWVLTLAEFTKLRYITQVRVIQFNI